MSIHADPPPQAVIDPEALLWCTFEIGRYEPRLFLEVVDWLERNHDRINVQRLKRLGPPEGDIRWRIASAVAAKVIRRPRSVNWRFLAREEFPFAGSLLEKTPLFLRANGNPLSGVHADDADFAGKGIAAPSIETRGQSTEPQLLIPCALLLRARALFGVNSAAEVWTALLGRLDALHAELCELTGFGTVRLVLQRFVECGICREERRTTA